MLWLILTGIPCGVHASTEIYKSWSQLLFFIFLPTHTLWTFYKWNKTKSLQKKLCIQKSLEIFCVKLMLIVFNQYSKQYFYHFVICTAGESSQWYLTWHILNIRDTKGQQKTVWYISCPVSTPISQTQYIYTSQVSLPTE